MKEFKSFQFTWFIVIVLIPLTIWIYFGYSYKLGNNPLSLNLMIILESVLLIAFLLFYGLKTTINKKIIKLKYGIGLITIKIHLDKIKSTKVVRNRWYYGLGIKIIPNGMLYNVHGLNAVELTFNHKSRIVRIGAQDSKQLKMEIDKRLIKSASNN